jgi:hypothetical protein
MPASGSRPRRRIHLALVASVTLLLLAIHTTAFAQDAPAPCSAPEYRQFDFWLGDWEVGNLAGVVVGRNTISSVSGGCGLHERWTGAGGGLGESLNAYDRRTDSWHQTWVGGLGLVLRLEGGLQEGSMVLEGELIEGDGVVQQRITWTLAADSSVRQLWETSQDGGGSWTTAFDGIYRKIDSR